MGEEYDYLFKSIVVGDGGVGKTALTLRFSKGFFTEDYKMTIGVDFHVKTIAIDSEEELIRAKLQIWDTGGQERFSSIRPMYYRGSLGALLIFDLTNSASFEHLPQWIEEVRTNVKTEIPLLLVGNKSDLVDQRAVSLDEINSFTHDFNLFYMETSAKTGEGVGDCFHILACLMIGSGVPDQLISGGIVFSPGNIPITASGTYVTSTPKVQSEFEYSAPPVPELMKVEKQKSFEPEPEFEYEAPPVPEPIPKEPILDTFETEFQPDIPIPEPAIIEPGPKPTEFDFKTPDEILAEEKVDSVSASAREATYKPKAIPFTSSAPVPAPRPVGFQSPQESVENTPTFIAPIEDPQIKSDSLMDYMPEPIYSKKDKKKLEKKKKKEEKEKKIQEEKEKQQKLLEEMKKVKKEKKGKVKKEKETKTTIPSIPPSSTTEPSSTPSLFQALTKKTDDTTKAMSSPFIQFGEKKETEIQESSKLRIIPNVSDIESKPSGFTPIQPVSTSQKAEPAQTNKELIICKNCGAILSTDYTFCNKCGSEL